MGRLVRVSLTGIAQLLIPHIAWISLVRIVSVFGSAALAGYTIGIRIFIFCIMPAWGLSGAAATLVGAESRAPGSGTGRRIGLETGLYNMLFLGGEGLILMVSPCRSFGSSPTTRP